jgi:hypothetical protein
MFAGGNADEVKTVYRKLIAVRSAAPAGSAATLPVGKWRRPASWSG